MTRLDLILMVATGIALAVAGYLVGYTHGFIVGWMGV